MEMENTNNKEELTIKTLDGKKAELSPEQEAVIKDMIAQVAKENQCSKKTFDEIEKEIDIMPSTHKRAKKPFVRRGVVARFPEFDDEEDDLSEEEEKEALEDWANELKESQGHLSSTLKGVFVGIFLVLVIMSVSGLSMPAALSTFYPAAAVVLIAYLIFVNK